jgi:hypothetical protein
MLITNLKELQSYREFQTTASINLVRTAVMNNIAPAGLTKIQTNRFNQKFLNNEWEVANIPLDRSANPANGVNRLVYKPNDKISLIVSYPDERNIHMTRIFKDRKKKKRFRNRTSSVLLSSRFIRTGYLYRSSWAF